MIEDIVKRLMENHRLDEMSLDRTKAIAVCMQLGDEFIEHFKKLYEEGIDSIDFNHHCGELQGWYKRVKRIVLSHNRKQISREQLVDWFFKAGSELDILFSDPEEASIYEDFIDKLLDSEDTVRVSDILIDLLK